MPELLPNSIVIQEESFNEEIYNKALNTKYVWVVDPIDGTKAFRDSNNKEWCVGVCLLEDLNPILSFIYLPESWLEEPYLLSCNEYRDEVFNFGNKLNSLRNKEVKYVSHTHRDTNRNEIESLIAELYPNNELIRAYAGHSTLAQFSEIIVNTNKIFTRRGANIWDIIQAAHLIEKVGGEVYYENGNRIFPLDPSILKYEDSHLWMPFTIGSSLENKKKIMKKLNSK